MSAMNENVLSSVKTIAGIPTDYAVFDSDILMHINSVLAGLAQMGLPQVLVDSDSTWSDICSENELVPVRSYVSLKVRSIFDPPSSSSTSQAIKDTLTELEWRIQLTLDGGE